MNNKIPKFHDFVAAGVSESVALRWHDAILLLLSHAETMAATIETSTNVTSMQKAAKNYREASK